eukprot:TRINITY_DN12678_c5_g4_i1.p1 TRINITY_DN12678_c5_g4~~TRINITY_DN12678_c5_g4_i1.p1  ORF type:complete len:1539 (+),score=419.12 TRINITY_DN12678_c5_g4_i1:454-5070(+)
MSKGTRQQTKQQGIKLDDNIVSQYPDQEQASMSGKKGKTADSSIINAMTAQFMTGQARPTLGTLTNNEEWIKFRSDLLEYLDLQQAPYVDNGTMHAGNLGDIARADDARRFTENNRQRTYAIIRQATDEMIGNDSEFFNDRTKATPKLALDAIEAEFFGGAAAPSNAIRMQKLYSKFTEIIMLDHTSVNGLNFDDFIKAIMAARRDLMTLGDDVANEATRFSSAILLANAIKTRGPKSWRNAVREVERDNKDLLDASKQAGKVRTLLAFVSALSGKMQGNTNTIKINGNTSSKVARQVQVQDDSSESDNDDSTAETKANKVFRKSAGNNRNTNGNNKKCGYCFMNNHTTEECFRNPNCTSRPDSFPKKLIGVVGASKQRGKYKAQRVALRHDDVTDTDAIDITGLMQAKRSSKAGKKFGSKNMVNIDSQANINLHGDADCLFDIVETDKIKFQGVGAENTVNKKGSIMMKIQDGSDEPTYIKIDDVYHCPALDEDEHLISGAWIEQHIDYDTVTFEGSKTPGYKFKDPHGGESTVVKQKYVNGLLRIPHATIIKAGEARAALVDENTKIIVAKDQTRPIYMASGASVLHEQSKSRDTKPTYLDLHIQYGHESRDAVLARAEAQGIKFIDTNESCIHCDTLNGKKKPDRKIAQREQEFSHQLEADYMGTKFNKGVGGVQWLQVVVDKHTNVVETVATKGKTAAEAAAGILHISAKTLLSTRSGSTVIKTDNGPEYQGEFVQQMGAAGIRHRTRPKDHPQKNGRVERYNGLLMDKFKVLSSTSGMSHEELTTLWPYIFHYATMVMNTKPIKKEGSEGVRSPYERLTGMKPPYERISSKFGAECWIKSNKGSKIEGNMLNAKFLYYDLAQNQYVVYVVATKKVQRSIDVHFTSEDPRATSGTTSIVYDDLFAPNAGSDSDDNDSDNEDQDQDEQEQASDSDDEADDDLPRLEDLPPLVAAIAKITRLCRQNRDLWEYPNDDGKIERSLLTDEELDLVYNAMQAKYLTDHRVEDHPNIRDALSGDNKAAWMKSLETEIANITEHATKIDKTTADQLRREGYRIYRTLTLCKIKRNADDSIDKFKTRIAALGNQVAQYGESFAPNAAPHHFRTFLAATNKKKAKYLSFDFKGAYLNAEMDPYIIIIDEIRDNDGNVIREREYWRMTRALYGIIEAGHEWWKTYHGHFTNDLNLYRSDKCICIYYDVDDNDDYVYAFVHTDDVLVAFNNEKTVNRMLDKIKSKFNITIDRKPTQFLGMKLDIDDDTVSISQPGYIDKLTSHYHVTTTKQTPLPPTARFSESQCPPAEDMANNNNKAIKQKFMELAGSLQYLAQWTRPDIATAISIVTRYMKNPGKPHLDALIHILKYLKRTRNYKLTYGKSKDDDLIFYSDASFQSDKDTSKSRSGTVVMYNGGAIVWLSKRQPIIAQSTMEAEYMALADASKKLIFVTELLDELGIKEQSSPPTMYCDNQAAITVANGKPTPEAEHIRRRFNIIREHVENKNIIVKDLRSAKQVADCMTKLLGRIEFDRFTQVILGQAEPLRP